MAPTLNKTATGQARAVMGRLVVGLMALMAGALLMQSLGATSVLLGVPGASGTAATANSIYTNIHHAINRFNPWNRATDESTSIFGPFVWDPIERFDTSGQQYGWIGITLFVIGAAIACFK